MTRPFAAERDPSPSRLRVGLMMDSYVQPAWVHHMIERVREAPHSQIVLIVMSDAGSGEDHEGRAGVRAKLATYWRSRHHLLYAFYRRLDGHRSLGGPDAFAPTDTSEVLAGVPAITVTPRRTRFSDYVSDEDMAAIVEQDLDVLVRLGFRILRGDILRAARAGVWSFHHGDNRVNRGGPAGFWEVMLGWPCTGSILQILNEDLDNGFVLDRSWASTNPVSVRANRNSYYWKSLSMLPRKLEQLHRMGTDAFLAEHVSVQDRPNFYSNRLFLKPTNRELARPFVNLHGRLLRRKLAEVVGFEQWELRYELRDGFGTSLWRMQPLVPPKDRFWADPHVVRRDALYYVFIEEFLYGTRRGRIAVMTIDDDGNISDPRPVLEQPYHLSYPFLFEWGGELFMIPETCERRTIELYRCDRFPDRWSLDRVLMEGITAVDATLIEHEERWWMFVGVRENVGGPFSDELFAFHATDPVSGEWTPHRANPIVSDVRRARPAGSFVRHDGALLRPAQDCARGYGSGLRLLRVEELTPSRYHEHEVALLEPNFASRVRGLHTIAHAGRLTMIDARSWRWGRRG